MHTTSLGGTSPRVFLQKVVRSEMGYMATQDDHQRAEGERGGEEEKEMREEVSVVTLKGQSGGSGMGLNFTG